MLGEISRNPRDRLSAKTRFGGWACMWLYTPQAFTSETSSVQSTFADGQ